MTDDLHFRTLAELGRALDAREVSARELTEHFLARIDAWDPKLNAFRCLARERALEEARRADETRRVTPKGPLHGLPYAAKDLFDVRGLATTAGCHLLEGNVAERNATVIDRLAEAGMVLLGKTHTVQFAYGGTGLNHDHGTPHNPWREEHHVPGGSSSGSAVAVAAGLAPMALGSDTGGSVRIPAALCGITGLKTTVGQVSRAGVYPLSWTLDSVGPLARSAEDTALVYQHLQGPDRYDPISEGRARQDVLGELGEGVRNLRLAFASSVFWEDADAQIVAAVRATREVFEALGARVAEIPFTEAEQARTLNRRGLVIAAEAWTLNRHWLEAHFDELDPVVAHRMVKGRDVSAEHYLAMTVEMQRLRASARLALEEVDALLVPTSPIPAVPVAELETSIEAYSERNLAYLRNTAIGNVLNLCGVSVPCGLTDRGLPIGLMIYAKPFREETALRIAHAYQGATDWHRRTPSLEWLR